MDSQLSPETIAALRGVVREISVAHDLDEEVQEELYGHMEDKALGYLSGEEAVSQVDVVLLTREHFGDARRLKDYLSHVHQVEAMVSWARRLVAVIVVGLGVAVASGVLRVALASALAWHIPYYHLSLNAMILDSIGPTIAGMLATFLILKHWLRRLELGEKVWFQTYTPARLFAITIGWGVLSLCIPVIQVDVVGGWTVPPQDVIAYRAYVHSGLLGILMYITPLIWIWWSDRKPRRIQAVLLTLTAYFGYHVIVTGFRLLLGIPMLEIHDTGMELTLFRYPNFAEGSLPPLESVMNLFLSLSFSTAIAVAGALALYGILLLVHRVYARSFRDSQGGRPWVAN